MMLAQLTPLEIAVIGLLFISLTWLLINYYGIFGKLAFYKAPDKAIPNTFPPVSVIICARNEEKNLDTFLPIVLGQEYPNFEVIVVNDCSNDNTDDLLRGLELQYPQLKQTKIAENDYYKHGKKLAVLIGIKAAKYEHLVFTDADCTPISTDWLQKIIANYTDKSEIVLGYGAYFPEPTFLNKLIRFDTFNIGMHYMSEAIKGRPYMGVGRNLSYKKDLFFRNKGFASHYHLTSGDDDLFINQVANKNIVAVALDKETFTYSVPKKSFDAWKEQKMRHLSTAPHYTPDTKNRLILYHFSNYFFYLSLLASLFFMPLCYFGIGAYLIKTINQLIVNKKCMDKLESTDLLWFTPILEIFLLFLYSFFHISSKFVKPNKWKK